jgi:hypothetical protein
MVSLIEMNQYPFACGVCLNRFLTEKEADHCRSSHAISVAPSIEDTLKERGKRYGEFEGHAEISQALQSVMRAAEKWEKLKPDQKEALTMIAHKIGRILNGDPDYHDSWHDIVGYTKLVADRILKESK